MSGWALLGLPGAVYSSGLKEAFWMIFGLLLGAYYNWTVVAPRLKSLYSTFKCSYHSRVSRKETWYKNSNSKIVSSAIIIGFFTFYSFGPSVRSKLFSTSFGLGYDQALLIGTGVILLYTVTGGFLAVSWTDFIQGILMAAALVVVPSVLYFDIVGADVTADLNQKAELTNISFFSAISLMAWGLGYMGQPHILTRFMAIADVSEMRKAKRIGMIWMAIVTVCAVAVGFLGIWFHQKVEMNFLQIQK